MLLSRKPLDVAADAETAPRVRFTSSGDNFPFAGTLRAVSYSVVYIICQQGRGQLLFGGYQASSPNQLRICPAV